MSTPFLILLIVLGCGLLGIIFFILGYALYDIFISWRIKKYPKDKKELLDAGKEIPKIEKEVDKIGEFNKHREYERLRRETLTGGVNRESDDIAKYLGQSERTIVQGKDVGNDEPNRGVVRLD